MTEPAGRPGDLRTFPRITLPPMYTLIRVRRNGSEHFNDIGHIYDISESGMRFELDFELPIGTEVEIRALLPGRMHTTVRAMGRIVRFHDDSDEPGPVRMGMVFDRFTPESDYDLLVDYLRQHEPRKAA